MRLTQIVDDSDKRALVVTVRGESRLVKGLRTMRDLATEALGEGAPLRKIIADRGIGKPASGAVGVQPEWFYKGDGSTLVAPGGDLVSPSFALDGGEEPEIVGLYLIDDDGQPARLGFALGNEFSDHAMERQNYLYLAHSKLRPASVGPELLVGDLPADVRGVSRIRRAKEIVWERPFASGEHNMSHAIANLEAHHFKYALFRQPGDVHVHFFGTATLSFADGFHAEKGDVFEIESEPFGLPLRNRLTIGKPDKVKLRVL